MRKAKKGFVSNPTLLITFITCVGIGSILLVVMIIFGFNQIRGNILLEIALVLLSLLIVFFMILIKKFTYKISFDNIYLSQHKGGKLINKFNLNDIKMTFLSTKYGYVNIEGVTTEGIYVVLSFEYSKTRGIIINKYFKKAIEDLPEKYK